MDPALDAVVAGCHSAELTVCGLIRPDRPQNVVGWAVNAFSVLRFTADALPNGSRAPKYLTKKPESSPDGKHQLFVVRSVLSVSEALALSTFQGSFIDPCAPRSYGPIESPGAWVGAIFVERAEQTVRACIPPLNRSLWLEECWQPREALQKEVGDKTVSWLQDRIRSLLNVSLRARRERIGNFLVVLPEERVKLRTQPSQTKELIGIEIRCAPGGPRDLMLVARGSRDRRAVSASAKLVGPGLHTMPMPSSIDYREVELYDTKTGLILDRCAGIPLRDLALGMNLITTPVDLHVNFMQPDGVTSDGEPIHVKTTWGLNRPMRVGSRPAWEEDLDEVLAEEEREALRRAEKFFVYRGGPDDRRRAVADIQRILHSQVADYLKVWDPYFAHRDAVEFLFYIFDPTIPVRVLTSLDPTDDERGKYRVTSTPGTRGRIRNTARATLSRFEETALSRRKVVQPLLRAAQALLGPARIPLAEWKKERMAKALRALREPLGAPGLTRLEVRSGGGPFHDRFIMTKGRCWQLGCSFNQIGSVTSTIVEFPYPAMIESEFDDAWKRGRAI